MVHALRDARQALEVGQREAQRPRHAPRDLERPRPELAGVPHRDGRGDMVRGKARPRVHRARPRVVHRRVAEEPALDRLVAPRLRADERLRGVGPVRAAGREQRRAVRRGERGAARAGERGEEGAAVEGRRARGRDPRSAPRDRAIHAVEQDEPRGAREKGAAHRRAPSRTPAGDASVAAVPPSVPAGAMPAMPPGATPSARACRSRQSR